MELKIDGRPVDAQPGETLLTLVRRLGLDTGELPTRPLAARMAGETFTLNYVPVRETAGGTRLPARRAVRMSHGEIALVRYDSNRGKCVYERSLLFVFLLAVRTLFPEARVHVDYVVGEAVFATVQKQPALTAADVDALRDECRRIVAADYPLVRQRMDIDDAIDFFASDGQTDKVNLLEWRRFTYFDVYGVGDYKDYFYGEMLRPRDLCPCSTCAWRTAACCCSGRPAEPGRARALPADAEAGRRVPRERRVGAAHALRRRGELNDMVRTGGIRQLIRVNEALHEKRYAQIADEIIRARRARGADRRAVSSGKTTSANRLCTQLRVHGKSPVLMSLDDYYIDRDKIQPDEKRPDRPRAHQHHRHGAVCRGPVPPAGGARRWRCRALISRPASA